MPRLQPSALSFQQLLDQRRDEEAARRAAEEEEQQYYDDEEAEEEVEEEDASIESQEEEESALDMAQQQAIRAAERARKHEEWVAKHANQTRFEHDESKARAKLLIAEARRNELTHLHHQLRRAKYALRKHRESLGLDASPCSSPERGSRVCSCCIAPPSKQLTAKYRAMLILRDRFGSENLEEAIETLRQTYNSDAEMLEDLTARYGPEPATIDDVDPELRLRNVEERLQTCDARWRDIGRAAMRDMQYRDNFPTVIRNLSIMRIFLEGSQSSVYGCDMTERQRRDAHHQAVLDRLNRQGALFETPSNKSQDNCATPSRHSAGSHHHNSHVATPMARKVVPMQEHRGRNIGPFRNK